MNAGGLDYTDPVSDVEPLMSPCPWCMSDSKPELTADEDDAGDGMVWIVCTNCHAHGPLVYSIPDAIEQWNRLSRIVEDATGR